MADEDEDALLFTEAMRDVRRIRRRPPAVVVPATPASPVVSAPRASGRQELEVEWAGEKVQAFAPGVPPRTRRDLKAGRLRPEATLDLHGARSAQVPARLTAFVATSRAHGRRCVLVVTGRGRRSGPEGPVLRRRAVETLAAAPASASVLGLASAPPRWGGEGALLVLLRRRG